MPPPPEHQTTLADACNIKQSNPLTDNQRKIVSLIGSGLCQATVAERLGFTSSYINQEIRKLLAFGLIRRIETHPDKKGKRSYTHFYELTPYLKEQMAGSGKEPFTATRMHYFRMKFTILKQSSPPAIDKRTGFTKEWHPRGWTGYKFWYSGKKGKPSVTIDVNPKSIVCYVDRAQYIPARNAEEATQLGWLAIYEARDKFIELQDRFGVTFEIQQTGTPLGKPHAGFVFHESWKHAQKDTALPGWHIDKSPEKELGPGWMEIESDNKGRYTPLEQGIQQLSTLPTAFQELNRIGDLEKEVHTVLAHIESGQVLENRLNQMVVLFAEMMKEQHTIQSQQAEILATFRRQKQ